MQTVEEIRAQLSHGDYAKLGDVLGVSRVYAFKLLSRPTAKRYDEAVEVAKKIAKFNQSLKKE